MDSPHYLHSTTAAKPLAPPTASKPPAPVPACLRRALAHKGNENIPERTRGESHALRDSFPIGMVCFQWQIKQLRFRCWLSANQSMRPSVCTVRGRIRRICLLHQRQTLPHGIVSPLPICRRRPLFGSIRWTRSWEVYCRLVPLHQLRRSY